MCGIVCLFGEKKSIDGFSDTDMVKQKLEYNLKIR